MKINNNFYLTTTFQNVSEGTVFSFEDVNTLFIKMEWVQDEYSEIWNAVRLSDGCRICFEPTDKIQVYNEATVITNPL